MTDADRLDRIELLFHGALERAPEERAAYLDRACADDEALRTEVEELLAADEGELEAPASAVTMASALDTAGGDRWLGRRLGAWTLREVLGTGGMGTVYLATRAGADFEQSAAVKLIRAGLASDEILARFRHERATLARLNHAGIASLLDGGATDEGVPWLAMEYVQGHPLDTWCDARRLPIDARLRLFGKVCDAVSYAHANLVVHRDLKPANILVNEDGDACLLDFGVAKMLDTEDSATLTSTAGAPMTPAFASPEQVRGESVGTASDVYSLGVILYELLTGCRPYRVEAQTAAAVQRAVLEQEPTRPSTALAPRMKRTAAHDASGIVDCAKYARLPPDKAPEPRPAALRGTTEAQLRRRLAGDLDNIVLKALAKEPERRYASVADLAQDIARHLAGLPVSARAPTALYRLGKFTRRHRVATLLTLALVIAAGVLVFNQMASMRRDREQLADIKRLSDGYRLADLLTEMDGPLWPARPDQINAMDAWLVRARELLDGRNAHEHRLGLLDERIAAGASDDTLWWHQQLGTLVEDLDAFAEPDVYGSTRPAMEARRALVDEVMATSRTQAVDDWAEACASIADRKACPAYGGLKIVPQWGLAPLRRNDATGLWEFWEVQSGERPELDSQDHIVVTERSALVFVLLPGGKAIMGAQALDPSEPHFDPMAQPDESPLHWAELSPFFLSKFEMTQGQWRTVAGSNPSNFQAHDNPPEPVDGRHPVEQMSWNEATETLRRLGLRLPTEAQWEYACRAGTRTPWWSGDDIRLLDEVANLADLHARDHHGSSGVTYEAAEAHDLFDGHSIHAPVGTFAASPFGLHDVHGNVWEWCRGMPAPYDRVLPSPGDGTRLIPASVADDQTRSVRGGAFSNPPSRIRSSKRWSAVRTFRTEAIGVRPARALEGAGDS